MQSNIFRTSPGVQKYNGCGRKCIRHKKYLGCMAGLTHAVVYVAAAGLLVVIQCEGTSS